MNKRNKHFARVVWWGYVKAPQTLTLALGHLNRTGFIIPKIKYYDKAKRKFNGRTKGTN
ncbi:hypothetical protein [Ornithobacterium rhinotracheale]|uniref:hypothetical protein n=1 Tax=Ornithobacterium rhinotracheale TaxID=28251 RepID=UPI0038733107